MNKEEHVSLIRETFQTILHLTQTKGEEYSNSADQHANFKRLSQRLGLEPEQVLLVYLTKHMDSIDAFIKKVAVVDPNTQVKTSEPIEGRVDDAILYLLLLKGLIRERAILQEQARLVHERPSRAHSAARGPGGEFHTGPVVGSVTEGGLVRGQVSHESTDLRLSDPALHRWAEGMAGVSGQSGCGILLSANRNLAPTPPADTVAHVRPGSRLADDDDNKSTGGGGTNVPVSG